MKRLMFECGNLRKAQGSTKTWLLRLTGAASFLAMAVVLLTAVGTTSIWPYAAAGVFGFSALILAAVAMKSAERDGTDRFVCISNLLQIGGWISICAGLLLQDDSMVILSAISGVPHFLSGFGFALLCVGIGVQFRNRKAAQR